MWRSCRFGSHSNITVNIAKAYEEDSQVADGAEQQGNAFDKPRWWF